MIWLIGGPARCGKSTLQRQARPYLDGQVLSWDSLKQAVLPIAAEPDKSELLLTIDNTKTTPEEWIALLRRRDRVLWKITKAFVETADHDGDNVIVEGNMWPDFVAELTSDFPYRIIFLVDTSPRQADRLIKIARSTSPNNWMSGWSEERLRHWAEYNIERSREIQRLGRQHNQPVFDIADDGIEAAQARALEHLRSSVID